MIAITGNDNLLEGCDVTNSNTGGISVTGARNTIRGNRSYKNWLSGISVGDGGEDNVIEWNESYESVHGTGIGGGPRNQSGSTARVDRTTYRYNYSHDNGKYRNSSGLLVQSPGIAGDPDGGGNSDGSGSSKACAKNTSENTCSGWRWDSNLLFGNSDDGMDNSATGYTVADNVMGENGPVGCRSVKVLNNTSGNTWERNVGFPNAASCPSTKDHGIEVSSSGGSTARDNVAYRIILMEGVTDGGGNLQQTLAPLDRNVPAGRPWERITTLYNRAKGIVPRLRALPPYPGEDGGPADPSFSIGDASATEGNTGTTNLTFTVSLSAASTQATTVNYATANGSATAGSDFTAASGTLSFPAGTTSKTISVAVLGDTTAEGDEDFFVNLSAATGATIADGQGKGTIRNDDTAAVSLSIGDATVTEGNAGTVNAVFTITLSPASTQTVTVDYATANGTATAGSDYTSAAGNLSFAPGTTTKTLTVAVTGDTAVEGNETFFVNLTNPAGASLADAQGQGTITNDDGASVTLTVSTKTAAPGQTVQAIVTNGPGNLKDWVGLYATGAADNVMLNWKYLADSRTAPTTAMKSATLNFAMPSVPGTFEFRFFANNTYTRLATSPTVTVQNAATPTLTVNTTTAAPGATVVLTVANGPGNLKDWITLNLASAGDQSYLDWKYLNGTRTAPLTGLKTATVSFTMPSAAGIYNFRLFANNTFTKLATSVTVTVQSTAAPTLTLNKTTATVGSTIQVTVTNGPGNPKDWMAMYPASGADTSYLDWKYLNGTRTAPSTGLKTTTLTFTLPTKPGTYNFRLFANNSTLKIATSGSVTVQ